MKSVRVSKATPAEIERLGARSWPIWTKEVSTFPWHYDEDETCVILEGQVRVEPVGGTAVEFGAGDLVVFPKGMDCVWTITKPVRKHYRFG